MMEYKGCNNCKYQPGPLLTCDWLKTQTGMCMRCPRWEPREQQEKPTMTKEQAINLLKMAAPIRQLNQEEFENFIIAINMAMDALEEKEIRKKEQQQKTQNQLSTGFEKKKHGAKISGGKNGNKRSYRNIR